MKAAVAAPVIPIMGMRLKFATGFTIAAIKYPELRLLCFSEAIYCGVLLAIPDVRRTEVEFVRTLLTKR